MAAATEAANSEGKQLLTKRETTIWKPTKALDCLLKNIPNVPDGKSEESESTSASPNEGDVSGSTGNGWYNLYADLDVWDSEISNIPESPGQQDASEHEVEDWDEELEESPGQQDASEHEVEDWDEELEESPGQQDASEHEVEDWDKELEESACGPYDADDLCCGSFEENNLVGSYVWKEDWFYNPGCHHTPCFDFPAQVRTVEKGQFDDADE